MRHTKDQNVIHLDSKWAFSGDKRCVTLFEKKVSVESGKLSYYPRGYYNNIQYMFERIVDHDTNAANSLAEIVERIEQLKQHIAKCFEILVEHPEVLQHITIVKKTEAKNDKAGRGTTTVIRGDQGCDKGQAKTTPQ